MGQEGQKKRKGKRGKEDEKSRSVSKTNNRIRETERDVGRGQDFYLLLKEIASRFDILAWYILVATSLSDRMLRKVHIASCL